MPTLISGNWGNLVNYIDSGENVMHVDFHLGRGEPGCYMENMDEVYRTTIESLREAQEKGFEYVVFTHGYSTSEPGQTTARSQVRSAMRDKESTPYVNKAQSLQHESVFIAVIRPKQGEETDAHHWDEHIFKYCGVDYWWRGKGKMKRTNPEIVGLLKLYPGQGDLPRHRTKFCRKRKVAQIDRE